MCVSGLVTVDALINMKKWIGLFCATFPVAKTCEKKTTKFARPKKKTTTL